MVDQVKPIKIDTETARAVTQHLLAAADELDPVLAKLTAITDSFQQETSANTKTGQQSPYYTPLDSSLSRAVRKIHQATVQTKRNILNDVRDISKLAGGMEEVADAAAAKIASIPT